MLKAAGLPVYRHLNVHGYWGLGGGKMSKSIGNVVEALALTDKYGHDAFRYFLLREMVFGLDADFSEDAFLGRLNADLANDLGNLVSRATTLIVNFGEGVVPSPNEGTTADAEVRAGLTKTLVDVESAMDGFAYHRALVAIWEWLGVLNRYVDTERPWTLGKTPAQRPRLDTVLYVLAESLRCLGIVLEPFLPVAAEKIRAAVGQRGKFSVADLEWGRIPAGTHVSKLAGLFPRTDLTGGAGSRALQESEKKEPTAKADANAGPPVAVSIDEFARLDLRVAEILAAEAVPKSKRLLKLTLSLGHEPRTVLAGIAEHYAPADLVGRKVVVVANLQPTTIMGIESNGMVLAGAGAGSLALLALDRELPPGSKVR